MQHISFYTNNEYDIDGPLYQTLHSGSMGALHFTNKKAEFDQHLSNEKLKEVHKLQTRNQSKTMHS
jgi:hypothetical protein